MPHYDMLVIGTGPAGQKAAIQAAKLGKTVGIIERKEVVGGVCTNTGTIPSKSLREAVLYLSGFHQRSLYGASYRVKQDITMEDLVFRANHVIRREVEIIYHQMARNNVHLLTGTAGFVDAHRLSVRTTRETVEHTADYIVIATGTMPARPLTSPSMTSRSSTRTDCWHSSNCRRRSPSSVAGSSARSTPPSWPPWESGSR